MKLERIVVGVDGSADSIAAVEWAAGLAALAGAEVVAVHALGLLDQARSHEVERTLVEEWCAPLAAAGVRTRHVLRNGSAVPVLLAVAEEVEADLVALGSRGVGSSPVHLLGSTSTQVSQQANHPVVIVPGATGGTTHGAHDVVQLDDGRSVLAREARPGDAATVAGLVGAPPEGTATLLALDGDEVVGVGRYWPVEGDAADVHVFVAPPFRGTGLGRKLLVLLGVHAFERGIRRFTASYPADQAAVDAFVTGSGLPHRSSAEGGTTHVEIELPGR